MHNLRLIVNFALTNYKNISAPCAEIYAGTRLEGAVCRSPCRSARDLQIRKRLHRPPFPVLSSAGGGDPRAAHRRATGGRYTGGGELARTTSSEGGTGAKKSSTTRNTDASARARHAAASSHRESSYNQDSNTASTAYDSYRTKRGRSGGEPVSLSAMETGSSRQSITPA